jgi:hypothetical protein
VFYSASIRDHLRALFADPDTASALGRAWEYAKERSNSLVGGTSTYCFSRSPSPFPVFFLCVSLSVFLRVRPASKTS